MSKDEALKMAIEALLYGTDHTNAIKACKEALEQPAQEPVATIQQFERKWIDKEALEQPPPKVEPFDVWAGTKPQPAQEPVDENDVSKALDYLYAVPNGYSLQPIDQERYERYVALLDKQIAWLQSVCADYAEKIVIAGEQKLKDVQSIKKVLTHPHQWQGLTDDEINKIFEDIIAGCYGDDGFYIKFTHAIEQALKEKNHG